MPRPFGTFGLWASATQMNQNPTKFTYSQNFTDYVGTTPNIITQINSAAAVGQKLVLAMTGGSHSNYLTNGFFDIDKWTARMDHFNTPAIKQAVADAVASGVVLGATMMDEPEHKSWGWTGADFQTSVTTRELLDTMADYVHNIFPTLPAGFNHGPTGYLWKPSSHHQKVDYIINQYNWWKYSGDVTRWRDEVIAQFTTDAVKMVWSINLLDGGNPSPSNMDPTEITTFGSALTGGVGLMTWTYDSTFFADSNNEAAFQTLANTMNGLSASSWKRAATTGGDITVIGTAASDGTTVNLPTFQAGDVAIVSAFNESGSAIPNLASGYTLVTADNAGGLVAVKVGTKILGSGDTTIGTWGGATNVQVIVLRHPNPTGTIGVKATQQASASSVIAYSALGTFTATDGRSRVLLSGVHSAATNVGTAPTGTTNQTVSASGKSAMHLSTTTLSTWSQQTVTVNASGTWRSRVIEIIAEPTGSPPAPQPPVLTAIANQNIQEGQTLSLTATATDPDSVSLTFSLTGTPPGNAQITAAGNFTYTPASGAAAGSPYTITVQVADETSLTDSKSFQVTVVAPIIPNPPVIATGVSNPLQRSSSPASSSD